MPVIKEPLETPEELHRNSLGHINIKSREQFEFEWDWVVNELLTLKKCTWAEEDREKVDYLLAVLESLGGTEQFQGNWSKTKTDYKKYDTVYNLGCKWICLTDGTTETPTWASSDWLYLSGDCSFKIEFETSNGTAFRAGKVDTYITAKICFGCFDVTETVMTGSHATGVEWTRTSSDTYSDNTWNPIVKEDSYGLCLRVNSYDVGDNFTKDRKVTFTLTLKIYTSKGYATVTKNINFKI